ncbi:MAG TPA: hypothetical protein VK979_01675 [Guyparkeria sp.]|nr:hypothetical protein [Guyparkeria sp.]
MRTEIDEPEFRAFRDDLERRYGMLIEMPVLARILGYDSSEAISKAIQRGSCPVPAARTSGRKSAVAYVDDVARYIYEVRRIAREKHREPEIRPIAQ